MKRFLNINTIFYLLSVCLFIFTLSNCYLFSGNLLIIDVATGMFVSLFVVYVLAIPLAIIHFILSIQALNNIINTTEIERNIINLCLHYSFTLFLVATFVKNSIDTFLLVVNNT